MVATVADPGDLALAMVPVALLMALNFYFHGRYLTERPMDLPAVAAMSFLDLALVTGLVVAWPGAPRGLASPFFALYYPPLLAVGFVAHRRLTAGYGVAALAAYGTACAGTDPALLASVADVKVLTLRLVTMAATIAIAHTYWRVRRAQRWVSTPEHTGRRSAGSAAG